MEFYTILEISEMLDISKSKLYYKIRSDKDFKSFFTKDLKNNSYICHKSNIESIANSLNITFKKSEKKTKNDCGTSISDTDILVLNSKDETILLLKDEIDFLKSQISEKDLQINRLLQITQNNQILLLNDRVVDDKVVDKKCSFFVRIKNYFKRY